jgi:spore maturation protein CgeB
MAITRRNNKPRRPKITEQPDPYYFRRGQEAGFPAGWQHGHWFGRCDAVIKKATVVPAVRPLHILFVMSGKGFPYSPIDEGVQVSLQSVAERVTVCTPQDDVIRLAAFHRPDLMLVLEGMNMSVEKVQGVNDLGIRTAVWFTDDPYYTDITTALAPYYQYVFTLERNCVSYYQSIGCAQVHHLPLGVFTASYRPNNPPYSTRNDISFIGSGYWNRIELFHRLLPLLAHRKLHISGIWWDRLPEYSRYKSFIQLGKWMGPVETSGRYNASRIVINSHRSADDETFNRNQAKITAVSPNPRTFEIAASGTLQMTDSRSELANYFVPGAEIVTYDSPQDLAVKAEYYLRNEEERQTIALRALYRTIRDHTYVSRLNHMIDILFPPILA